MNHDGQHGGDAAVLGSADARDDHARLGDVKHAQVRASNGAMVDNGMLELLESLWRNGVTTLYSCQEYGQRTVNDETRYGYICFADFWDAVQFVHYSRWICMTCLETNGSKGFVQFPTSAIPE